MDDFERRVEDGHAVVVCTSLSNEDATERMRAEPPPATGEWELYDRPPFQCPNHADRKHLVFAAVTKT